MFALANLSGDGRGVLSFSANPERYHELLEVDGVFPALTWHEFSGSPWSGTTYSPQRS